MSEWKSSLKSDPTDWLLGVDNPSVRYFTLVNLLDLPVDDREVIAAKSQIMKEGVIPKILAKQNPEGYWGKPENFYIRSKYKGTIWQLIILAELGAAENDDRIKKTIEFILQNSQDPHSGGFSYLSANHGGGDPDKILPCLTGNMVWSMIRFGHLQDPGVQKGINWIVKYQHFDDGDETAPTGWPYDRYEKCWGRHTCHMGVVKALKALAEIPLADRSPGVIATIEMAVEYLLIHHIHKRSHDLSRISNPKWVQFGFPLMWTTDALEILGILTKLGNKDPRMQEAVNLVISKQDDLGRWTLERTFNGRFQVNIERKGKPSKWITLNALQVLKRFASLVA